MADLVLAALIDSGLGVSTGDLFVGADIPDGKLNNAWRTCQVPDGEIAQGLIDLTIFGSAKDALVFGSRGLYFHNDGGTPTDHQFLWADWAHDAGAGFHAVANLAGFVGMPDGVKLYMSCDIKPPVIAALLNDIHQRVLTDAAAAGADDAAADPAAPAARPTVPGPVIEAPTGADAQDQAAWRHLLADMQADLNEAVGRLLYDRSVGTDLRVFALAGDARADLLIVFVSESGDLLVAVWGNKELPSALSLAHAARKRLSDEFGFHVLTGQGLAFARSFGPAGEADAEEVASLVRDLVFVVFDLPRGGLAVSWELADG